MPLKDIVVFVDTGRANEARLTLAVALARRHEAHLAGVHIVPRPEIPPYLDSTIVRRIVKDRSERAAAIAAKLAATFRERGRREGVSVEWRIARDFYEEGLVQARYADLVIAGQENPDDPSPPMMARTTPADLALSCGRPVLAIPYAGRFAGVGRNVVVAWQPCREATRAVNDSLGLIEPDASVTVLVVNPAEYYGHGEEPGADIARHLARHGIKAQVERAVSPDIGVADTILSRAADLGADLIVMGAYGHSRLREFILGGVTRSMLRQMTVPVLMSN
jgi:nucleotide-binding universal stress UspA family protein